MSLQMVSSFRNSPLLSGMSQQNFSGYKDIRWNYTHVASNEMIMWEISRRQPQFLVSCVVIITGLFLLGFLQNLRR